MCTIYSPMLAPLIYSTLPWPPTPTGKSWGQMRGCLCLSYQGMKLYMKLRRCNAGHDVRGYHFNKRTMLGVHTGNIMNVHNSNGSFYNIKAK